MFTGIIESLGELVEKKEEGSNIHFGFRSDISKELKIDQSVSHNGVCLTVTACDASMHYVTAVQETLIKSNLGSLNIGDLVNLERCMVMNGRLDGHIVQGHVDATAEVIAVTDTNGSWIYEFGFKEIEPLMVEKGSVCINGVSLTCFDIAKRSFKVAIIPYTYEHTNFKKLQKRSTVNIEFDIIGKYIQKLINQTTYDS
ncbi:MAG: riboflavin synthase [Cyclobacteriaceae bacterium]